MRSVLLFRLGGLGDLLVAYPSIYLVRKLLHPCSITLVCREEYGRLLKETGVVDTILSLNEPQLSPLFTSPPYPEDIVRRLDGFSFILGWMQKKGSLNIEEFCTFREKKRCLSFIFDPDFQGSITRYFFQKTAEFLAPEKGNLPAFQECSFLPLNPEQKHEGLKLLGELALISEKKIAVIHPGSGGERKSWPFENFMEVIFRLADAGMRGVLVTGPAEERLEEKIRASSLPAGWVWLHNPPLLKIAGLLSASSLYLGNDSGITHLAASCGAKGVALFLAEFEALWRPFGRISTLAGESMSDISVDSVWEAVSKSFS